MLLKILHLHILPSSRITFNLLASIIGHKHAKQTNKHTKNKAPIKREALKERTKG
jgi:hypothetical protein